MAEVPKWWQRQVKTPTYELYDEALFRPSTPDNKTIYSFSRDAGDILGPEWRGKEVLLPLVHGGREMDEEEAIECYRKTGEHLGMFPSIEDANAAGDYYHRVEELRGKVQGKKPGPRGHRQSPEYVALFHLEIFGLHPPVQMKKYHERT